MERGADGVWTKRMIVWFRRQILHRLQSIDSKLDLLLQRERRIEMTLEELKAKVAEATTVEEGAITLLGQLSADLKAAKTDPAAIQAIADSIDAEKAKLADALTANTPSA
jgi:chromosome segregation ATPase